MPSLLSKTARPSRGFTLIELLIVVAIIAILAAIAVPNFLEAQTRSKTSRARTDMRSIATALESYAVDNNKYPPLLGDTGSGQSQVWNYRNGYNSIRNAVWRGVPQQVTTPISYLTSIIPDVFKLNTNCKSDYATTVDLGKPYTTGNPFDTSFVYQNIKQLVDSYAQPSTVYNEKDIEAYGFWRLMSVGPDQKYNLLGSDNTVDSLAWIYDSTNGTLSPGMLIRTQRDPQNTNSSRKP